ncbi:MAG: O-methyltransferase [Mycobacterium sp.]
MCSVWYTRKRVCDNVSRVEEPDPKALDQLFNSLLRTEDDALTATREAADAAGMPAIEVSAQHGKLLYLLAVAARATRVLEIGTLAGYSTINLARGVGPSGRVVTLEYEPAHAEVARRNLARAGVEDRVEVIVGAALDSLPDLAERGETFDLSFIDADKENNVAYVEWAIKLSHPGSIILVDNIARFGRVLEPTGDDHQARAVRDMLAMMGEHPRLDAAAIQTVGTKGWDGFAVALVKES